MSNGGDNGVGKISNDAPKAPESTISKSPEAQQARHADKADIAQVESARTNASDGSLGRFSSSNLHELGQSIEIVSDDKIASRKSDLREKDLRKDVLLSELSKTGQELIERAQDNPVLGPVAELRKFADSLEAGPQKDLLVALSREQAADISPEMRDRLDKLAIRRTLIDQSELDKAGLFKLADLHSSAQIKITETTSTTGIERSGGYLEQPVEAAQTGIKHWKPSDGTLNFFDPASWSKLQQYAGDVGRKNGWSKEDNEKRHIDTFPQVNALRHALASAYITFHGGAASAMVAGDWHELQTSIEEAAQGIPWKHDAKSQQTWRDHAVDINNNLAGAKIAQQILDHGGSWQDVENAIVNSIKHDLGKDGRLPQPNYRLHTFLDRR